MKQRLIEKLKTLYLHVVSRSVTWMWLTVGCGTLLLLGGKIALIGIIMSLMCAIQCAYLISMGK